MPRKARSWKDYPEDYFKLLELVDELKETIELRMPERQAKSRRNDLYRFFAALRHNSDVVEDPYQRKLAKIAKAVVLRTTSLGLEIELNAISIAMAQGKTLSIVRDKPSKGNAPPHGPYDKAEIERLIEERKSKT